MTAVTVVEEEEATAETDAEASDHDDERGRITARNDAAASVDTPVVMDTITADATASDAAHPTISSATTSDADGVAPLARDATVNGTAVSPTATTADDASSADPIRQHGRRETDGVDGAATAEACSTTEATECATGLAAAGTVQLLTTC